MLRFKRGEGSALRTDSVINSYFRHLLGRKCLTGFSHLVITKTRAAACFQAFTIDQAVCKAFHLRYLIEGFVFFREEKAGELVGIRAVGSGADYRVHLLSVPM